jgi:hypothetical protein
MTNCQVSEEWKNDSITAQMTMSRMAPTKAHLELSHREDRRELSEVITFGFETNLGRNPADDAA